MTFFSVQDWCPSCLVHRLISLLLHLFIFPLFRFFECISFVYNYGLHFKHTHWLFIDQIHERLSVCMGYKKKLTFHGYSVINEHGQELYFPPCPPPDHFEDPEHRVSAGLSKPSEIGSKSRTHSFIHSSFLSGYCAQALA